MTAQLWENVAPSVQVVAPGLVVMKAALSQAQQIWLAQYALAAGSSDKHNFFTVLPSGEKVLNSDTGRGRIYDAITEFADPDTIRHLCNTLVAKARALDVKMPEMQPTHLLLLYYATHDGMYMHKDSDPNDGDNDHPIVSLSIGNSCDFVYKLVGKAETTVRLESGDILIWGGPNRMLLHGVDRVHPNTTPDFLPIKDKRLNFTYRDAPNVLGRESTFKYSVESHNAALMADTTALTAGM